jgi:(R,R)-butanediol dehydrogenase / meso-butanediol dehydrogenase / diacetyl reductase
MRAAVYHGRRDVRVEDVPSVRSPGPDEIVVDVVRAAICGTDSGEWAYGPMMSAANRPHPVTGHSGPFVLGHEFVGVVREVGDQVVGIGLGQRVVPGCGAWCGHCRWCREGRTQLCRHRYLIGMHRDGGLAEAAVVPSAMCHTVAANISDEAAAIAQPLAVALHGLNRAAPEPASTLVVIGAGGIGSLVVAAAHARGHQTIVIDPSEARLARARELGADHAISAGASDVVRRVYDITGPDGPGVVVEASGAPPAPALAGGLVRPGGRILLMGMQAEPRALDLFSMVQWEVDVVTSNAHVCGTDLPDALALLATTDLADRVIAHRIGLSALVRAGLVPLSDGTARGKIVVDPRT